MRTDSEEAVVRRRSSFFCLRLPITNPTLFEERHRLMPTQVEKLLRLTRF